MESQTPQDVKEDPRILHTVPIQFPVDHFLKQSLGVQGNGVVLRVMQPRVSPRNGSKVKPLQPGQQFESIGFECTPNFLYQFVAIFCAGVVDTFEVFCQLGVGIYRANMRRTHFGGVLLVLGCSTTSICVTVL